MTQTAPRPARLTPADIRRMTPDQITAHWQAVQQDRAARGEPHYTALIDPQTGKTVARVEDGR